MIVLDVENLSIAFGRGSERVQAVRGVSFSLGEGECLAIVGESGSGKTVTSRALLGLSGDDAELSSDRLEIAGRDARGFTDSEWRGLRGSTIGLVSQDALVSLDPLRTIGREVAEPLELHHRGRNRLGRAELHQQVLDALSRVAIPDPEQRARQYSHELSGGLRQRALIASALAAGPSILIADEPTTALDVTIQAQVLELLGELKASGVSILLISHDLSVVARLADRIAVMNNGVFVETGTAAEVLENPQHEYTKALLASVPTSAAKGTRLSAEPGAEFEGESAVVDRSAVVLEARGIRKSFRQPDGTPRLAVDDVSFQLRAGTTLGIVGESGSGKTTVARIVMALERADAGEVLLHGAPWTAVTERDRRDRRESIQVIYQDPLGSFDPRYSVARLIGEAVALTGLRRSERLARIVELLGQVGLDRSFLNRRPLQLSGGQRQRVAIARALARNPSILVCDEPVSALDVSIQAQVLDLLADLQRRFGLSLLFISHDLGVIYHVCDEMLVMKDGEVVERGTVEEIFTAPKHPYTLQLLAALPTPIAR